MVPIYIYISSLSLFTVCTPYKLLLKNRSVKDSLNSDSVNGSSMLLSLCFIIPLHIQNSVLTFSKEKSSESICSIGPQKRIHVIKLDKVHSTSCKHCWDVSHSGVGMLLILPRYMYVISLRSIVMISFKWFSLHWGTDHIDTIYKKTLHPPNTKNTDAIYMR